MLTPYELLKVAQYPSSELDVLDSVQKGLPVKTLSILEEELSLSREHVCAIIGISPRTMHRRKRLKLDEADKLYRLARVFTLAVNVLGGKELALKWLNAPKIALNNKIPLELLNTGIGTREIEKLLRQIEYGVYV